MNSTVHMTALTRPADEWCPFICDRCESTRNVGQSNHDWKHPIVLCRPSAVNGDKEQGEGGTEMRALREELANLKGALEDKLIAHQREMEDQLAMHQRQLDDKLAGIERMLQALLDKASAV